MTRINLNVFTLGSYDIIIGMDWLAKYKVILNCFDKTLTYVAEDLIVRTIEGVSNPISLRKIYSIQLKKCMRKGCKLYMVWVTDMLLNKGQTHVKDNPVLREFMDVFSEEIPRLPPPREI